MNDLFKLNCTKVMYRKNKGILHSYHSEQLKTKSETETIARATRQKHDVIIKGHNSTSKINSINSKIGSAWNNLPFEIKHREFKHIGAFTKQIKKHYLSSYSFDCTKNSVMSVKYHNNGHTISYRNIPQNGPIVT